MGDDGFALGYLLRRRSGRKPWRPGPRKRPKMPSTLWRFWAVVTFVAGATIAYALFGDTDAAWLRVGFGGLVGFAIGMYVVETVWERREARRRPPTSPIGPRR